MCALFLVLPCINVIYVDDFRVIDKGKNTFVEVIRITSTCIPNVPFFSNIFEFKIYLFKIPNHFLRNPFLNFDKNLNPSCVMEGKKKEKNVSERVKRRLCS